MAHSSKSPKEKNKLYSSPDDRDLVLRLSKEKNTFRFIQALSQGNNYHYIIDLLGKNDELLGNLKNLIPVAQELLDIYNKIQEYKKKNPNDYCYYIKIIPGTPSDTLKEMVRQLRLIYNKVSKWGRIFTETAAELRREGLIQPPLVNPNRNGNHYQSALGFADILKEYWFVKKIVLFGSVASGTETEKSDVDLVIEIFDSRAIVRHIIEGIAADFRIETGLTVSPLIIGPKSTKRSKVFFNNAGFFEATETIFEREGWTFIIGEQEFNYKPNDYLAFNYFDKTDLCFYLLFKSNQEGSNKVVVLQDNKPLVICTGVYRYINSLSIKPTISAANRELTKDEKIIIGNYLLKDSWFKIRVIKPSTIG